MTLEKRRVPVKRRTELKVRRRILVSCRVYNFASGLDATSYLSTSDKYAGSLLSSYLSDTHTLKYTHLSGCFNTTCHKEHSISPLKTSTLWLLSVKVCTVLDLLTEISLQDTWVWLRSLLNLLSWRSLLSPVTIWWVECGSLYFLGLFVSVQ